MFNYHYAHRRAKQERAEALGEMIAGAYVWIARMLKRLVGVKS